MSRNRKTFLLLAVVLVLSMTCFALFVGCKDASAKDPVESGGEGGITITNPGDGEQQPGKSVTVDKADRYITFDLVSEKADISELVTVVDSAKTSVKVTVQNVGDDKFRVYPPVGGYDMFGVYTIAIGEGVSFAKYPDARSVRFTVTQDMIQNVRLSDGVLEFDEKSLATEVISGGFNADGVEYGTLSLQTNGLSLAAGDVFVINNADGTKEAFKVNTVSVADANSIVSYVKPDLGEIYDDFEFSGKEELNETSDYKINNNDDTVQELATSALATDIISIFASKPEFSVNAEMVDNALVASVRITVPNVVQVEGLGSTALTIEISNKLSATALSSVFKLEQGVQFDLKALISNDITTKVTLGSNASVTEIQNAQEIVDKLAELAAKQSGGDAVSVPLFKWAVPLAEGAVIIDYDADLVFRFSFSGSFDLEAKASLDYVVGASYDEKDGLQTIAENTVAQMDSLDVTLQGVATVKAGVIQELGLNVLGGVLGVRLAAELGNYNRLYGFAQTNNLLEEDPYMVGGVYFEGGFYYDLDITFGVKIGSLINLSQKVDIVAGEMKLYEAGNRELILSLNPKANGTIDAFVSKLPAYQVTTYDLVTGATAVRDIDPSELTYTIVGENNNVSLEGDVLTVLNKEGNFNVTVQVAITGSEITPVETTYTYVGAIVFEKNDLAFAKTTAGVKNGLKVGLQISKTEAAPEVFVDGEAIAFSYDAEILTVNGRALSKLTNSVKTLTVKVGDLSASALITVGGQLGVYDLETNGVYELYTADQILDMIAKSADQNFAGKAFILTDDIDMNGSALTAVKEFAGTLNGAGYKIYNYNIGSLTDNTAALFAVNSGKIENVAFEGNVNVTIDAAYKTDYNVAGVVGENKGELKNVTFTGNVEVYSTSLNSYIEFNVGGLAAKSGDLTDCTASANVKFTYKFALVNVTVNIGGLTSTQADENASVRTECQYGIASLTNVNIAG